MTEAERVELYNDLCDFELELHAITYPPQSKKINTLRRAIAFVGGTRGRWVCDASATPVFDGNRIIYYESCKCNQCSFSNHTLSTFKFCPSCGARMQR